MNENKETKAAAQDSEFSLSAVPESERKSYISLTIIWTGFVFVIVSMMAGGTLAVGLDFKHVIYATLIGNVFLCLIAVAVSVIASKTGLTFALLTRYSFGTMGSKLASIFVPIVNIGWYFDRNEFVQGCIYLRNTFADDPMFQNLKIAVSIYDDAFPGTLDAGFRKKIENEGIKDPKLALLDSPSYENLMKLVIDYADGVVMRTEHPSPLITAALEGTGKVLLPWQPSDATDYLDNYQKFYEELLQ